MSSTNEPGIRIPAYYEKKIHSINIQGIVCVGQLDIVCVCIHDDNTNVQVKRENSNAGRNSEGTIMCVGTVTLTLGEGVRSLANLPESLFSGVLTLTICMRGL